MVSPPVDEDRVGLVMVGEDNRHDLAFVIAAGLNLETAELEFLSSTAAPETADIPISNPAEHPENILNEIIDHKARMSDEKKQFYVDEIEERLYPFFRESIDEICEKIRNVSKQEFDDYFQSEISNEVFFSSELTTRTVFVDFDEIELDSPEVASPDQSEKMPDSRDRDDQPEMVLEISPVISATKGTVAEKLEEGVEVLVRLAGESAKLLGFDPDDPDKNPPPLTAEVINFDMEPGESEGELTVKIQEGIHGQTEVPGETKIQQTEEVEPAPDPNVQRLETVIWTVVGGLILVVLILLGLTFFV